MTPELEQKVLSALPPGEKLVAGFTVSRSLASSRSRDWSSSAPDSRRPKVLVGQEKEGDGWARFVARVFRVFTNDVPSQQRGTSIEDPSLRGRRQKDKEPFFGGWDSLAGQFLIAGQPKSKTGAAAVVAVTDVCMRFVYVQYRRVLGGLGEAVELGASFPHDAVVWTRRHAPKNEMQFGFSDGSWGTLFVSGEDDFVRHFPGTLGHKEPIP
ncbi:hypothetical protein [Streptomyces chrestomyceticus]|uniref:hypothetical protein n=1 Tax=Streptomyces chrestomyceticus TaxID=68185 RepID=UPI0019D007C8|nr:hypothetical protein [Streptomyces chrestomyceticus]